jgi:hypothetical protein
LFQAFNSPAVVDKLSELVGVQLYPDNGLHGGGWHIHGKGGHLGLWSHAAANISRLNCSRKSVQSLTVQSFLTLHRIPGTA